MAERICSIEGCDKRHMGRGYCAMHYRRWRVHGDPNFVHPYGPPRRYVAPVEDRLRAKIHVADNGCWEWTGRRCQEGYGSLIINGRINLTHRISYELHVGPIPEGLHIDHLCRNRSCCNPEHLEPVTPKVNSLRGVGRGALNAAKTHCPQGHPYSGDNLRVVCGRRECRTCHAERRRAKASRAVPHG